MAFIMEITRVDFDVTCVNTSVGKIPLVLINESNGYYGGWIDMHINKKNESNKIE